MKAPGIVTRKARRPRGARMEKSVVLKEFADLSSHSKLSL